MTNKAEEKKTILVGGQAVMEGVMMRTPKAYATAVRNPEGEIITERKEFTSLAKKSNFTGGRSFAALFPWLNP